VLKPLTESSFRTLFLARTLSSAGDSFLPVALAFAVLELTGSAVDLGLVLAAATLPSLLLLPVGGVWGDRLPRGRVMLLADLVRAIVQAAIAALLVSGRAEVWHLLVLQVVDGSAEAFFNPASGAIVPETVSGARLREANALLGFSTGLSYAVGPGVAGLLIAATSPGWAIAFDALTFLASAVILTRLRLPGRANPTSSSFRRDLVEGWAEFRSRTWVWLMVLHWSFLLLLAEAPLDVLGPVVATRSLGGAEAWGVIEAGFALGLLGGRLVAARYSPARPMFASALALLVAVPSYALLAGPAWLPAIVVARFIAGASFTFYGTLWMTTLQQFVPAERLSRVTSYEWFGSMAFMPLGYVLAGPLSEAIGTSRVLWLSSVWVLASTVLVAAHTSVRKLRSEPGSVTDG
jgi:MFS family permease